MTHMAPELLLHGQISKASDVYAYGVLLWELYTAGHAFKVRFVLAIRRGKEEALGQGPSICQRSADRGDNAAVRMCCPNMPKDQLTCTAYVPTQQYGWGTR